MITQRQRKQSLILSSLCLALICFAFGSVSSGQQNAVTRDLSQYIGLRYGPDLPRGLVYGGGGLITDPYKDTTQFGLTHVTRGSTNMIWFELLTHHDAKGKAYWEVLDVTSTPPLRRKQYVMVTLCLFNNKPDPEIAAVVESVPRSYNLRVIKAWRANRQSRKLEAISVKGVKCEMQGDD